MIVTTLKSNGEVLVVEGDVKHLWTGGKGWQQWIKSDGVIGGGYWRVTSSEDTLKILDMQKQRAIAAMAARSVSDGQTTDDNDGVSE